MLGKPSHRTRKRLSEHGVKASATVLEVASRGMTITNGNEAYVGNTQVMLKTRLRVEPTGEPAFEVEERFRFPQLSIPQAGSRLAVVYDPGDHEKIMLDDDPVAITQAAHGGRMSPEQLDLVTRVTQAASSGASIDQVQEIARRWREANGGGLTLINGAGGAETAVDQLERLAALRDRGVLTDAEFEAQKRKVLEDG